MLYLGNQFFIELLLFVEQARVARSMVRANQRLIPWKPIHFDTS